MPKPTAATRNETKTTETPDPKSNPSSPKEKVSKSTKRKVKYPELKIRRLIGKEALDAEGAKQLLGWTEESENVKFGSDYLLQVDGVKVRCSNNSNNRPYQPSLAAAWKGEILGRNWKFNGETIIIGKTGLVLSGQHRLIGLVLAHQEFKANGGSVNSELKKKGKRTWRGKVTMDVIIVLGIDESDEVVNTIDTAKPRTLSDVLYRSEYYADLGSKDRKKLADITAWAIKTVADRTGDSSGFSMTRTHSHNIQFLDRHPKIIEDAKHIHIEDGGGGSIATYSRPGYASGLLYLMACSATDPNKYDGTEDSLDFSRWDKACEFWVLLASGDKRMEAVKQVFSKFQTDDPEEDIPSDPVTRAAYLVKAWNLFVEGKPITEEAIQLQWEEDEEGFYFLGEHPVVGGIDRQEEEE